MKNQIRNKIILWFCAILWLMMANASILAQNKVNVTLVKDLTLSEATKLTVFDFENPENPRLKVEVFDKKVIFYNKDGEANAVIEYDEPIGVDYSENEQFFSVAKVNEYPTTNEAGQYQVDFYDAKGNKLCTIVTMLYAELPPPKFSISNTGTIIELNSIDGNLALYNKTGQLLKKINFYQFSDMGTALSSRFSISGNLLVVGVNYPLTETQQKNSEIILYDSFGSEKWRFKSNQGYVSSQMFISRDEQYVISSHYNQPKYEKKGNKPSSGPDNLTTYILNAKTGAIQLEHPNIRAREVLFFRHNSTDYALLNDVGDQALYINLTNGRIETTYSLLPDEEILGMDIDFHTQKIGIIKGSTKDEKLAHRGYRRTFSKPLLEFFDLSGRLIWKQSITIPQLNEYLPNNQFKFFDTGRKLRIHLVSGKKLMLFDINQNK